MHILPGNPLYIRYDVDNRAHTKYDFKNQQWMQYDGKLPKSYKEHFDEYIRNKKLNADFSKDRVDKICSTIQQQEQQNFSQLDTSRLLDDKSQFYKEEKRSNNSVAASTKIYKINNQSKSAVRFTKDKEHNDVISAMALALQDAIKETKRVCSSTSNVVIDKAFIKKVIDFAIQNDGVGMKQSAWQYGDEEFKIAKRLSYEYQKAAKQYQLFTGNESQNLRRNADKTIVGARLKRIPKQYIESIVESATKVSEQKYDLSS